MTLAPTTPCPNGQHIMDGTTCIICGQFFSPLRLPRDIQEEVNDVCQSSTNIPKD